MLNNIKPLYHKKLSERGMCVKFKDSVMNFKKNK